MKEISVLFVGNSYTHYNDMPKSIFAKLAKKEGYDVKLTQVTKDGYRLCQFADPNTEGGAELRNAICGAHYDFAIIQEQSLNPITNEKEFLDGACKVTDLIPADHFILYATWGRNDESEELAALSLTREEMTEKLSAAYHKAGKLIGARVAEVGKAFLAYAREKDKNELYNPDNSHPSKTGSSLAARVILDCIVG